MPIQTTHEQRVALRRAARNGEYHLMLGSGSSLDSKDNSGRTLPSSQNLISRLSSKFEVPVEEGDLLWRVYDRAIEIAGHEAVYKWFRVNFWNVVPPYWMEYYARSPWRTVWTLNIDDTFESAYQSIKTETMSRIASLNWDDDYRDDRQLNVIHLHGMVDTEKPRRLIFSLSEYAGSAAEKAAWPTNFRDIYGNSPFVIIGARLRDEPDIESVISGRRPSNSAPTFYVSRTISKATREDLIRWGLIPVEMSAEEFVLEWAELTKLNLDSGIGSDMENGLQVGQQFQELTSNTTSVVPKDHDFLGGDEPTWNDVLAGQAAELAWVTKAKTDCNDVGNSLPKSTVIAYAGRRLTGRSTGLYLLAQHLRRSHWRTFIFRKNGKISIDPILGIASGERPIALLFDGMADVADDIDHLIGQSKHAGLSVICVAVDQLSKEANILGRVHTSNLAHSRVGAINLKLTGTDASRLVDTLAAVGRLGILEPKSDKFRRKHFTHNNIFDSMAQIENAPGFGTRMRELLRGFENKERLDLVIIAAYTSYTAGQLLIIDAARMIGMESDELVRQITSDHQLASLLSTDGTQLRTRHRWMALEPIVATLGAEAAANVVRDGIRRVSLRLNRQSLRERNPTSLMVGGFMSHRNLSANFEGANLEKWYESLLPIFGNWSGRYWEQRSILARKSDSSQLARAESFALRATQLVPDTYSFTTLGTVLLEKAARAEVDVSEYYERACDAFERAVKMDSSTDNIVAWMAQLRSSLKVLKRLASPTFLDPPGGHATELFERIQEDWTAIYSQFRIMSEASEAVSADLKSLRVAFDNIGHDL